MVQKMTVKSVLEYIVLALYFFFTGVEYAVIIPTLNEFLLSLGSGTTFYGVVLSSFSFAGLVTAPLFGYLTDKTRSLKLCIIFGNIMEIVGNFLYFVGRSMYFVWCGRIASGLGSGSMSAVFGTLSRETTSQQRTSSFAILMMLRQIGLLVGPGFNAFLLKIDFKMGPFNVNKYTAPGLFMTTVWVLHTILFVFIYHDKGNSQHQSNTENGTTQYGAVNETSATVPEIRSKLKINFIQEYLREEIVILLATAFIGTFVQTGVESSITPMTLMYFGWHGFENSMMLLCTGGVIMAGFATVHFATRCVSDATLLIGGCVGISIGYGLFFVYELILYHCYQSYETPSWLLAIFCINLFIWVFSLAFLFVPLISLFSKLTNLETQGFHQGMRMAMMRVGMILGPLWASPMMTRSRICIMAGINFGLLIILLLMAIASRKRLIEADAIAENGSHSEVSSLLISDDERNSQTAIIS